MKLFAEAHSLIDKFKTEYRETNERLKKIEFRLEKLEKQHDPGQPSVLPESLAYDRHGNPKGGLKKGDWLLGHGFGGLPCLFIGEFSKMDTTKGVWANWRHITRFKDEGMAGPIQQTRLPRENVRFLFHPKFMGESDG